MKSAIQWERECWACGRTNDLHLHHIFPGTANRRISDAYGYVVYLCQEHHTGARGVHFDKTFDLALKVIAQKHFEKHHGDRTQFISRFGRSYL